MRHACLALTLSLLSLPAAGEEITGSGFSTGYWTGSAQTGEAGGFSHCTVSIGYTNGETLWLGLYANDTLSVLLSSPRVRFQPGNTFDAWLMTEVGLPTKGISEAWDEAFAGMTLTGIDASIEFLTAGRYLRQIGIGIDDSFDVQGIDKALALGRDCVDRHARLGAIKRTPQDTEPKTSLGISPGSGAQAQQAP